MTKTECNWTRRMFIMALGGSSAAVILNPISSWSMSDINPTVLAIVNKTIGIDIHNHIDVPFQPSELPGPDLDLVGELNNSGLSGISITFAVDRPKLINPGEAYDRFKTGLTSIDNLLKKNNLTRAKTIEDIRTFHRDKKKFVIQSIEGGHFLEGQLNRLQEAYERGLRQLGLLHDNDASVPLGDVYTNPPQWGGLTSFGADVIRECNRLGILVDLTHANNETIDAALKVATRPVVISHTGLNTQTGTNESMATMMRPRLISKEQAKIVADAGGVIGVWTHLAATPNEYAENIKAMVNVAGIAHVCIGTDTKLATPSNNDRPGQRTNEAWQDQKNGFYYTVVDSLLKTGFNEDQIEQIGGKNFLRVFEAATKG